MTMAIVVMVVVIVIVGGAGFAALSAVSGSGNKTVSTCSPPTSPICQSSSGLNDVILSVPYQAGFGQAVATTTQGTSIPATVAVSGGESVSQYQIFWGDGAIYTNASPTSNHIYTEMGWYVISAQALVGSTWHTGPKYLYPIDVTSSYQTSYSGFYPVLATTFTNGSSASTQFGWLSGSGSVSVSATYTSNSTATGYTDQPPTLTATTGATQSGLVSTPTSVSASYAFSAAGLYYITMVGAVTAPTGTIYQNYTWTVFVSPTGIAPGCGSCSGASGPPPASPHAGKIIYQEVAPGGATSEDPAVAYDTLSYEPILNVYQTLVTYNGSSTASYVPQVSLCVPGPDCLAKYGSSMIVNDATTSSPRYFTFPIDPAARFYDPTTKVSWPVYPSDMAFAVARTCAFADLPGFGAQNGWILCQSLLDIGSSKWDGGIHAPFNNTPQNVMGSMLINDSKYCPTAVMTASNGCITFNVWGGGAAWPFFLELVTDPLGASVTPCGWFSAQQATVPGFTGTTAASGDGPCYLPGATAGTTSTNSTSFQTWLTSTPLTAWDALELLALNTPGIQPGVRWNMVGSGPYYLTGQPFEQSVGYTLAQNPAYAAPTGCKGQPGCEPLPGTSHYAGTVTVVYQSTDTVGIEQYKAGQTDFASILPGETPQMLSLIQEGKIGAFTVPTLSVFFLPLAMEFDPTAAKTLDPNVLNIPGDFFNYVALREFLVNAFPYTTVENTIFTTDGIQYGFNYGGAIPQFMGNYYPTNISWPSTDPVASTTTNGSAGWWWTQATTAGGKYYDSELASCTKAAPCQFPIIGQKGATTVDQMIQDYMPYIVQISGGRLAPNTFDVTFTQLVVYSLSALPGQSALPYFNLGWAPDYPDPTDYAAPLYYPDATYTSGDAVQEGLSLFTCANDNGGPTTWASMAGLVYWANLGPIPQACQGNAYAAMEWGMTTAAGLAVGPFRVLMYNLVEHIANQLALYVYYDQSNAVTTYASWINPTTININPTIGGGGDNTWYLYGGNGVWNS